MSELPVPPKTDPADLHIVVAAIAGKTDRALIGFTAFSAPLTYTEALEQWDRLDKRTKGAHILYYAVRSITDPRFAPLVGRGYADAVSKWTDRDGVAHVGRGRLSGEEKAAMAWAKANGYKGRGGGWIEDANGGIICQGWGSFAYLCKRQGRIAEGSDGKWYVIDRELVK